MKIRSQLTNVLVDEAAEWTEKQILFLMTRMRSASFNGKLQMVLSTNPSHTSYLYEWVKPLLDEETGVPREGVEKIVRWFVVDNDKVKFADTPEELYELYGFGKTLWDDFRPKSFRMVPLSIYHNKILLKNNPEYLANLLTQSKANQLKYLMGSWTAIAGNGTYWKRDYGENNLINASDVPLDCEWVRAYDFGASEPSTALPNPDYSASCKMGKSKSTGLYYVADVDRWRENMPKTLENVKRAAYADGLDECTTVIPRDPGAGGKFALQYIVKELAEAGIGVKTEVTTGWTSKLSKFLPFCSLCESNNVKFVRASWNEELFSELALFDGGNRKNKDDQVDAVSSAFKQLCRQSTLPTFTLSNSSFTRPSPLPN